MRQQPFASPGEALEHHGVKGMRWGVRNTNKQFAKADRLRNKEAPALFSRGKKRTDRKARKKIRKAGELERVVNNKVALKANKSAEKEMKALRKKPEFQNINYRDANNQPKFDIDKYRALDKAEAKIWTKHLNDVVKGYDFDVKTSEGGTWQLVPKKIQHADGNTVLVVRPIRDDNGYIIDIEIIGEMMENELAQADKLIARGADFLEHFGVKGMRWGIRKAEDLAAERAGKGNVGFIDPVSAAYIAVFLGLAVKSVRDLRRLSKDSGEHFQKQNKDVPWKKKADLAKPAPPMDVDKIFESVVKPTNPRYPKSGSKMNCRRCTFAYEMRRRGLDVHATPSFYATGQDDQGVKKATMQKDQKFESIWGQKQVATPEVIRKATPEQRSTLIFNEIGKNPNGARGELGVGWSFMGGHSMAWEVVNNKPVVFDTQTREVYKGPNDFKKFAGIIDAAAITRTDNRKLDEDFLRRWAVNHA